VSGFTAAQDRDAAELFRLLDQELAGADIEAELCLVGGAVVVLAFHAVPESRRIRSLVRSTEPVRIAAARVADRVGLGPEWLSTAVRRFLGGSAAFGPLLERASLRVFVARPEYVLAMRCASMLVEQGAGPDDDVRYLLRYLDVFTPEDAMERIGRYLPERQLPDDIESRLSAIMGSS